MTVLFHPEFPSDVLRMEAYYAEISAALGQKFRASVLDAIDAVRTRPDSAGHFLNTGSEVITAVRRKNLKGFPFFILYAIKDDTLVFGSLIPSTSDPLLWLRRFPDVG